MKTKQEIVENWLPRYTETAIIRLYQSYLVDQLHEVCGAVR